MPRNSTVLSRRVERCELGITVPHFELFLSLLIAAEQRVQLSQRKLSFCDVEPSRPLNSKQLDFFNNRVLPS